MIALTLNKPVEFNDKVYQQLKFNEPNGITIAQCGVPFKTAEDKKMTIDSMAMHNLIAACADVPHEVVDMLKPKDWFDASVVVMGFFGDTT